MSESEKSAEENEEGKKEIQESSRDPVSGLTLEQRDSFNRFVYGDDYDSDPERRWIRARGGHCSGGGGPC